MKVHTPTSSKRIPASVHGIQPQQLSKAAYDVIKTLQKAGFAAYIVGGGVRDLLLGKHPKDFDVATDAHPEDIKPLFKRCILIGKRFRLAHVYFGRHIIEVATFRSSTTQATTDETSQTLQHHATTGMIMRDNIYGTLEDDVFRRDFTINALYYDPTSGDILDFTNGYHDLQHHCLRIIGEPSQRFREDPVRILRAIRFMSKLNFKLHPETEKPLTALGHLFSHVSNSRLSDEFNKLFLSAHGFANFNLLKEHHLLSSLFAQTTAALSEDASGTFLLLIENALRSSDERVKMEKPVTPAFLFAALLWKPYLLRIPFFQKHHHQSYYIASLSAANEVINNQNTLIGIPKRLGAFIREVWHLQNVLSSFRKRHFTRVIRHPRFRAAYDFLVLRAASGENCQPAAEWWTQYQSCNDHDRHEMMNKVGKPK